MVKLKLRELLQERNMTQKQLAEMTNTRAATISAICNETSKMVNLELLDKICHALDCEVGDILEKSAIDNPSTEKPTDEEVLSAMRALFATKDLFSPGNDGFTISKRIIEDYFKKNREE